MPNETCLVVGAKGMLGSMMVERLTAAGIPAAGIDIQELDITNARQTAEVVARRQPATIVNCAAYTQVDEAELHEDIALAVNAAGVQNLARAAKAAGSRLVHLSTDYVFSGTQEDGYAEGANPDPRGAYGRTKRAGEVALMDEGVDFLLVRTAWLYGPRGKNFVDTIRQKLQAGEALQVVGDQVGSPTYTGDLADAITALLIERVPSGIYHLVNSGRASWYDLACAVRDELRLDSEIREVTTDAFPRPAPRPHYSVLLNTKRPPLPVWRDALTRYLTHL
jgi:dTDP-4-dehydrorhamnose reductase